MFFQTLTEHKLYLVGGLNCQAAMIYWSLQQFHNNTATTSKKRYLMISRYTSINVPKITRDSWITLKHFRHPTELDSPLDRPNHEWSCYVNEGHRICMTGFRCGKYGEHILKYGQPVCFRIASQTHQPSLTVALKIFVTRSQFAALTRSHKVWPPVMGWPQWVL